MLITLTTLPMSSSGALRRDALRSLNCLVRNYARMLIWISERVEMLLSLCIPDHPMPASVLLNIRLYERVRLHRLKRLYRPRPHGPRHESDAEVGKRLAQLSDACLRNSFVLENSLEGDLILCTRQHRDARHAAINPSPLSNSSHVGAPFGVRRTIQHPALARATTNACPSLIRSSRSIIRTSRGPGGAMPSGTESSCWIRRSKSSSAA
jgi:hypothetical protein